MSAADVARGYLRRGWCPIPVPFKSKKPNTSGWQHSQLREEDLEKAFSGKTNIGIILGPKSSGLTDADLDCPEAVALAPHFLEPTSAIFGRSSNPNSHWLYQTSLAQAGSKSVIQYRDPMQPKEDGMLVEIRIGGETGAQTVFPGSVHETGEPIEWSGRGEPAKVENGKLVAGVSMLASACLLARYWPGEGSRHDAALTLGGFLSRAGHQPAQIKYFVEAIARAAGDPDYRDRKRAAEDAANAHRNGKHARGFTGLSETFGKEVATRVAEWLEHRGPASDGSAHSRDSDVERLNEKHAVLPIGGKTRVVTFGELEDFPGRETIVMTQTIADFKSLNDKYRHSWRDEKGNLKSVPMGTYWIGSPNRRQYDGGMAFLPHHDGDVGDRLNLYRGFGVKPIKPDGTSGAVGCQKFLDFMRDIICNGNEADFDYLRKREATILQKRIRTEIALGLRTKEEGCGKGFYEAAMGRLLGNHAMQVTNPKHIIGNFNPHLETLLRLTADEALFVHNPEHRNALFGLITEPTLTIEPKGCSVYTADSYLNLSLTSNADHFLPVSGTARRFFIPTVSAARKQDFAYFAALKAELEHGGYEALLYHLLHEVNLADFDVRKVPQTEELRQQRNHSLPPLDAWWCELLETGTLWGADPKEPYRAVSNSYQRQIETRTQSAFGGTTTHIRHVDQLGIYDQARQLEPRLKKNYVNDHHLGAHLKEMGCDNTHKVLRRRGWTFPPLSECRTVWEKRYTVWTWRDPAITKWRAEEADDVVSAGSDGADDTDDDDACDNVVRKSARF